jgi:hypothetical protein
MFKTELAKIILYRVHAAPKQIMEVRLWIFYRGYSQMYLNCRQHTRAGTNYPTDSLTLGAHFYMLYRCSTMVFVQNQCEAASCLRTELDFTAESC